MLTKLFFRRVGPFDDQGPDVGLLEQIRGRTLIVDQEGNDRERTVAVIDLERFEPAARMTLLELCLGGAQRSFAFFGRWFLIRDSGGRGSLRAGNGHFDLGVDLPLLLLGQGLERTDYEHPEQRK